MRQMTVLLVEDNADDEELSLWALNQAGQTDVTVARDGVQALSLLLQDQGSSRFSPDVVILDLRLPLVDGIEVLRQLRANEKTKELKIFALTSSEAPPDMVSCMEFGVSAVLSKPLDSKILQEYL